MASAVLLQITAARGTARDNNQSMTTLTTSLIGADAGSSRVEAGSNSASYLSASLTDVQHSTPGLILPVLWSFSPTDTRMLLHFATLRS